MRIEPHGDHQLSARWIEGWRLPDDARQFVQNWIRGWDIAPATFDLGEPRRTDLNAKHVPKAPPDTPFPERWLRSGREEASS